MDGHGGINTIYVATNAEGEPDYAFFKESHAHSHAKNVEGQVFPVTKEDIVGLALEQTAGVANDDQSWLKVKVTKELLAAVPGMTGAGYKVGDELLIPKDDTQSTEAEVAEDVARAVAEGKVKNPTGKKSTAPKKK